MAQSRRNIIFTLSLMAVACAVVRTDDCAENELSCAGAGKNETCILRTRECDGKIDCPDGSDEELERCRSRSTGRPMLALAFHCSNRISRDLYTVALCHPLCFRFPLPDLCFYAMMTMYEQPVGTCKIPDYPVNGTYEVTGLFSYSEITLHYSCMIGHDLWGADYLSCVNGNWAQEIPTCKPLSGWVVAEENLRK